MTDAESAEHGVPSGNLVIVPVSCPVPGRPAGAPSLVGEGRIQLRPDSRAFRIYGGETIVEEYFCSYEVNPGYQARLDRAGLRITGTGPAGEARIVELPAHRFFLATLFQPMLASAPGKPHVVITTFLDAARRFRDETARPA